MRQFSTAKPWTFAAFISVCIILVGSAAGASVQAPSASEAKPSGRRVATRALQRSTSTEWPVDVAARLRALAEHAERAAREHRATNAPRIER